MPACFAIAFSPMTCSYSSSWEVVTKQSKCYRTLPYHADRTITASDLGRVRGEEVVFLGVVKDLRAHEPGVDGRDRDVEGRELLSKRRTHGLHSMLSSGVRLSEDRDESFVVLRTKRACARQQWRAPAVQRAARGAAMSMASRSHLWAVATSPTQRFTAQPGPLMSPAMLEICTMRAPWPGALRRAGRKVWMSRILPK